MKREFTAVYKKDKDWYIAWVEEVPGAMTQGRTLREATANLKDALSLILETNRALALGKFDDVERKSISIQVPALS